MTDTGSSALLAVVTSTATRDEARHIAATLVGRGLVSCAQLSDIESVYRWQGAVHQAAECRLLLKTTVARYAEVEAAIRALHSYELPAIFALPVDRAFNDYADWVREETT